jgi:iron complex outermembrane receptor protein
MLSFLHVFEGLLGFSGSYGKRVGGWNNQVDASLPNGIFDREIPLEGYTIDIRWL